MIVWLALPLELRLILLFVGGSIVGAAVNLAIERLRWNQGTSHAWFPDPERSSRAHWFDWLPVVGWFTWRRQAERYGRGFWLRPLLIELLTGAIFAGLYWWEVDQQGLLPPLLAVRRMPPGIWPAPGGVIIALHLMYQSHIILMALMIAATFIDIDDRVIPDSITLPGTLAGLILAGLVPWSLLPSAVFVWGAAPPVIEFLKHMSPEFWTPRWDGWPNRFSLYVGLACYWGWCFALLPRRWRGRHGVKRACQILLARLVREPISYLVLGLAIAGAIAIAIVWWIGEAHWAGLITALVGVAGGGGLVWAVRIVASVSLGKEAMGFGDVTLMAMIGAFLGWQTAVLIFFLAPLFAVLIGLANWIVRSDHEIPYGPFLCLAAAAAMAGWRDLWQWAGGRFFLPIWLMPLVLVFCLALMAILLGGMRLLGKLFRHDSD
jgi:prepilin signal peptidase PulO-like enzyme (type II secretory pathway)